MACIFNGPSYVLPSTGTLAYLNNIAPIVVTFTTVDLPRIPPHPPPSFQPTFKLTYLPQTMCIWHCS